jgi:uncharacterized protein (DUF3820 family)
MAKYTPPPLTDNSQMPFGKYKGEKMINVPASYLMFLFENNKTTPAVAKYIAFNMDAIQKELNSGKR